MTPLEDAVRTALLKNMAMTAEDTCLVITDHNKLDIGNVFYNQAKLITENAKLIVMPEIEVSGQEPPEDVAREMLNYSVIMIPTSKSISHTKARRDAVENGARLASMPGITVDMATRCLNADYKEIQERTKKLVDLEDKGKTVRVTTRLGTDITMSIEGLKCKGANAGIFDKPGKWGNLPEGESNMAPVEGSTNGVFIVDKTMAGVGKVKEPIRITVKEGFAVDIQGGKEADELKSILESVGDKNVYNIAEIGIGTNHKAIITGNTLEDEKVMGTAHIALGNNMSYDGGTCDAKLHLDGIMDKPTIWIDDKKVIEDGVFLV